MVLGTDVGALLDARQCVLALQPPGFDPPELLRDGATCVGAVLRPGGAETLDPATAALLTEPGNPWVLLSLSTTLQGQAEALPGLLGALGFLPIRVLLTLGGVLAPDTVPAPANVTMRGFLSHEAVMPHMAAVITHAGMSTVATSLAAGMPMVCVPQGARPVPERGEGRGTRSRTDGATRRATGGADRSSANCPRRKQVPDRRAAARGQRGGRRERRTRNGSGPGPGRRRHGLAVIIATSGRSSASRSRNPVFSLRAGQRSCPVRRRGPRARSNFASARRAPACSRCRRGQVRRVRRSAFPVSLRCRTDG